MMTLDQNKQILYYSLFKSEVPVYLKDENGNIVYQEIDGMEYPVVECTKNDYSTPVEFEANISGNSGETRLADYGLNVGDYDAIIVANKGEFPFTEQTLIWHKTTPVITDDGVKPESADYKVVAIKTSLNEERFVLKKREKNGAAAPAPSA